MSRKARTRSSSKTFAHGISPRTIFANTVSPSAKPYPPPPSRLGQQRRVYHAGVAVQPADAQGIPGDPGDPGFPGRCPGLVSFGTFGAEDMRAEGLARWAVNRGVTSPK